ncbi:MAG TPA: asparagine synthase (glutamine-hydrolyzing) [Chloroflexota bacterium]|nr:asparagine synthase (glutamine-hydrolyzing) [Chloroflexota bacterium]
MCGIAGWIDYRGARADVARLLEQMKRAIYHRGPDEDGSFQDEHAAIGMQRLAIIDLAGGQQPMSNEDGTLWIVFNGEIYNYPALRPQLEARGHRFLTNSDTEAILHLYEDLGDDCATALEGMFAFCIWDTRRRRALLVRDRLGKKPLFYTEAAGGLLFGSELKALLCHPATPREVDLESLDTYLALNYTLAPRTMLRGVRQVLPGHRLAYEDGRARESAYWEPHVADPPADPLEEFRALLEDAVRKRLLSDVPLGAFLSGGIDSSSVVALMQRHMGEPVRTFCLAFEQSGWGEQDFAALAARHIGTRHEEARVPDAERTLADELPRIVAALDEPHGDSSAIPMYYLCEATRRGMTVALSGDGGDEALAGYETYLADRALPLYRLLPRPVRTGVVGPLVRALPGSGQKVGLDEQLRRFVAGAELAPDRAHLAWRQIAGVDERRELLAGDARDVARHHDPFDDALALCPSLDEFSGVRRFMYCDLRTWLPNDILVKADRMSMAHSLEVRAPFLDHRLVELALRLPDRWLLRGTTKKAILKDAMRGLLPDRILDRKKRGFNAPVRHWMTGPLRDLLQETVVREPLPYFEPGSAERLVGRLATGREEYSLQVWGLLTFYLWHDWMRRWTPPAPATSSRSWELRPRVSLAR